ncbi:MAG: DUF4252 domain-containing protein [Bacteroidia bacterium]|nr:MAG: DUF4252 domain-containing protein [Bacteroidia bacterium]
MKRLFLVLFIAIFAVSLSGQNSIDRLFEKYSGKEGFVTVSINGNLLKLIASIDDDDDEIMKHADKFTTIRILAQEDDNVAVENFYDMVIDEVNRSGYEELVTINSSDADVKILVKADGKVFSEFLLIAGGDENALIQIKGKLSSDDIKEMSESVKDGKSIHTSSLFN